MGIYKLTSPCTMIDINGNLVDAEKMVIFDNKKELIEYLHGDVDGDNYGSGLLRIKDCDEKLYKEIGRMCNRISYLLQQEKTNSEKQKTARICKQIVNYMLFSTSKNAEKLYPVLQETRLPFLGNCYLRMMNMDVDGDRPWEEEWCDKFIGMIRTDPKAFAAVSTHAANCVIDAWKD